MPRDKIILITAFVSGLLAFVLVFSQLNKASKPSYMVAVAALPIKAGQTLSAKDVMISKPLRDIKVDDFFLQTVDAIGMIPVEPIKKGDPIRRSKTAMSLASAPAAPAQTAHADEAPELNPLPIPPGMRAMELGPAEVDKIPDLIQIGHFVDLFGYRGGAASEMSVLVFSAPVLDVRRVADRGVTSLSVALTLDEAGDVSAGLKKGKLRLAVRTEPGEKIARLARPGSMEVIRGASAPAVVSFTTSSGSPGGADAGGVE